MSSIINRRNFVVTGAAAGLSMAIPSKSEAQAPAVITRSAFKPMVIASGNGNRFKNGGTQTAVEKAFSMITSGSDVLDAVVAGVNIVELDPLDSSVGYAAFQTPKVSCSSTPASCTAQERERVELPESKACALLPASRRKSPIRRITISSSERALRISRVRWDSPSKQT